MGVNGCATMIQRSIQIAKELTTEAKELEAARATIAELQARLLVASEEAREAIQAREDMQDALSKCAREANELIGELDAQTGLTEYVENELRKSHAEIERLRAELRAKEMEGVSLP
jgi:chromosome segregation ATPase